MPFLSFQTFGSYLRFLFYLHNIVNLPFFQIGMTTLWVGTRFDSPHPCKGWSASGLGEAKMKTLKYLTPHLYQDLLIYIFK